MDATHTEERNGHTIEIFHDENPDSPREWDNLGVMLCKHHRYSLGDHARTLDPSAYESWDTIAAELKKQEGAVVVLPLYLYDHSSITMRTSPFGCAWDSGQVGVIYATRADILKEFGVKRISRQLLARVRDILKGEVKTYDQYITGDVYTYVVTKTKHCDACGHDEREVIDSCGGYYGMEDALKEARADALLKAGTANAHDTYREAIGYGSGYAILPYFEGGVGESAHRAICENLGLSFRQLSSGKACDVFHITVKGVGA